jgi:hypothetical protein
MPHFKCVACRTRLYSEGNPPDEVGDLCPSCGSVLEPVSELTELVGFRSITSCDDAADGADPDPHEGFAERFDSFVARREAMLAQARLDAERWLDDGGSLRTEAVALPPPETNP